MGLGWNDRSSQSSILIQFTYNGDTNLDLSVNFDDLLALAQSYGLPGKWANGDSDYNGTVEFDDLLALAQNYGRSLLSANEVAQLTNVAGANFVSDWALATAVVPEPGMLMAGIVLATSTRRRNG